MDAPWWRRVPDRVVDAALGAAFLLGTVIERVVAASPRLPLAVALAGLVAAGLALRRRAPVLGYLVGSAGLLIGALTLPTSLVAPYANFIGIYSVGLYATGRRVWWGPPLATVGVVAYFGGFRPATASVLFSWLLAWALGYSIARRKAEQQVSQRLLRQQAITDERARIARELHDLVGHTVNVMLVQVGAARRIVDRDPARTAALLSTVEDTGRDALAELDRMLGILRPQETIEPGLAALPGLAQRLERAGITVTLDVDPTPVPASLSLSAYRIVQEALTNALKHGRATTATVTVRHLGSTLDVEVDDDGRGVPDGYQLGRGLLGIGERVALFGGQIEHGGGERGGFRVRAVLPVP